jgi:hypothetical protein
MELSLGMKIDEWELPEPVAAQAEEENL